MKKIILLVAMGAALTTQTLFAQVPSYVPTNGLVGYWPFNGNANDESGIGNNGTVNGATLTSDRFGNSNSAYSFDGNDDVVIPSSVSIETISNSFSISVWSKIDSFNNFGLFPIIDKNNLCPSTSGSTPLFINGSNSTNGYHYQSINCGTQNMIGIEGESSILNQWVNTVVSYDGISLKIYRDGVLKSSNPYNISVSINSSNLTIGHALFGVPHFAYGLIDDIGIWNRALRETEIAAMHNGVSYSDTCNAVSGSLTQGLVGYWPFCGNANDDSGNGNNGTVNGATLTTDRFGNANSAYSFDGVDDYISTTYSGIIGNSSRTISAWVKVGNLNGFGSIVNYGSTTSLNGGGDRYSCQIRNDGMKGVSIDIDGSRITYSEQFLDIWHHYIWVYDQNISNSISDVKIYADGLLLSNISENYVPFPSAGIINTIIDENVKFGSLNNTLNFNGIIDDIGIWNRALTPNEVTQLYNQNQCFTNTTVTDTLIINVGQLSYTNPIAYANNIIIAPNPASSQININFNNITNLNGGTLKIINSLGQEVATTPITTSGTNSTMQLATWGGTGMYFVQIINPQGQIVDIKKIILQ